jgi:hypothetical protein
VPELDLLDAPDTTSSCEMRPVSTTAPQALTFLNGAFANEMAKEFAQRLEREAGSDPAAQVSRAFELVFCRPPSDGEIHTCVEFLAVQNRPLDADTKQTDEARRKALAAFCLVLLNANEFMYVN